MAFESSGMPEPPRRRWLTIVAEVSGIVGALAGIAALVVSILSLHHDVAVDPYPTPSSVIRATQTPTDVKPAPVSSPKREPIDSIGYAVAPREIDSRWAIACLAGWAVSLFAAGFGDVDTWFRWRALSSIAASAIAILTLLDTGVPGSVLDRQFWAAVVTAMLVGLAAVIAGRLVEAAGEITRLVLEDFLDE